MVVCFMVVVAGRRSVTLEVSSIGSGVVFVEDIGLIEVVVVICVIALNVDTVVGASGIT